jgi:pyruvate kinase
VVDDVPCMLAYLLFVPRFPVESVATMRSIIDAAEQWQDKNDKISDSLFEMVKEVCEVHMCVFRWRLKALTW